MLARTSVCDRYWRRRAMKRPFASSLGLSRRRLHHIDSKITQRHAKQKMSGTSTGATNPRQMINQFLWHCGYAKSLIQAREQLCFSEHRYCAKLQIAATTDTQIVRDESNPTHGTALRMVVPGPSPPNLTAAKSIDCESSSQPTRLLSSLSSLSSSLQYRSYAPGKWAASIDFLLAFRIVFASCTKVHASTRARASWLVSSTHGPECSFSSLIGR